MNCGHVNRAIARFCARCGAALVSPTPAPKPAQAPATASASGAQTPPPRPQRTEAATPQSQAQPQTQPQPQPQPQQNTHSDSMYAMGDTDSPQQSGHGIVPGKLALWLTGAVTVGILAAIVSWVYFLNRSSVHPHIAPSKPWVSPQKSVPPPAASTPPLVTVPPERSASNKAAPPASKDNRGAGGKIAASATDLSEQQTAQIIRRLQQERQPASCAAGEDRVKRKANVSSVQARDIAKRAYPRLCAPAVAMPEVAEPPKAASSIDQAFKQRSATECEGGISGLICQEKLRRKLCEGRWSSAQTSGQKVCHQADHAPHY